LTHSGNASAIPRRYIGKESVGFLDMKRRLISSSVVLLVFLLTACQPAGASISASSPTVTLTAASSTEPSPATADTETATTTPTLTSTPTHTPTPTLIPTVTPTPIAMPNLRVIFNNLDGIWSVKPPEPPVLLEANKYVNQLMLSEDGTIAVYMIDPIGFGHPSTIGAVTIADSRDRILLSRSQINTLEKDSESMDVEWIPGTHRMLFYTLHWDDHWGFVSDNNLFILNLDTGGYSRIFTAGFGGKATPSPDGKRMAIAKYGSLSLASIGGKVIFPDLFPSDFEEDRSNFFPSIFWALDSSHLGIIFKPYYPRDTSILLVDTSTGIASKLRSIANFSQGTLSPTLEFVGYSIEGKSQYLSYDATILKIDGSSSFLLAKGVSRFDSFSPDGQHFTFEVGCASNEQDCPSNAPRVEIFLGSLDGSSFVIPHANRFIKWINNSQFIYLKGKSLQVGDISGNFIEIATAGDFLSVDAVDLDFHEGL
jgi:hypothetical protein